MTLSVVVVNWNTRDYLLEALASLRANAASGGQEEIVVDNASADGSADAVARAHPEVQLIRNETNAGYARGNNQGISAARGRHVLLLNPDVLVPACALDCAVGILDEDTSIGALGAKLVHPDGAVQRSVRGFPTPWAVACEALGLSRLFPRSRIFAGYRMPWFDYDRRTDVDQPMGTFLMIRGEALRVVGPLDERFPIFFNEVDWCLRARRCGYRIVYAPDVRIVHHGGAGTRQIAAEMAWESRRGLLTFYRKHYRGLAFAPAYWLAAVTSYVHASLVSRRRQVNRSAKGGDD